MTSTRSRASARLTAILTLAAAAMLAGGQETSAAHSNYQLTGTNTVTDTSSGVRKQIKHWRNEDGTMTQSTKVVFDPQAGRPPRGTKPSH